MKMRMTRMKKEMSKIRPHFFNGRIMLYSRPECGNEFAGPEAVVIISNRSGPTNGRAPLDSSAWLSVNMSMAAAQESTAAHDWPPADVGILNTLL